MNPILRVPLERRDDRQRRGLKAVRDSEGEKGKRSGAIVVMAMRETARYDGIIFKHS